MANRAIIIVTDKYYAQTGEYEKIKAEQLRDHLTAIGWVVNDDLGKVVVSQAEFITLRNWLNTPSVDPPNEDKYLIYVSDQVQLGPVSISFNDGPIDTQMEIDHYFHKPMKEFLEFTLVYLGPRSGRVGMHDQVHLGPQSLFICSMDENEDLMQDQFNLQYSLIGENFLEAARLERARLLLEPTPQHVWMRYIGNEVP